MTSKLSPGGSELSVVGAEEALWQSPKGGDIMMHLNVSQGAYVSEAGRQRWGQEMAVDKQSGL